VGFAVGFCIYKHEEVRKAPEVQKQGQSGRKFLTIPSGITVERIQTLN
jgi:hypothetical protein